MKDMLKDFMEFERIQARYENTSLTIILTKKTSKKGNVRHAACVNIEPITAEKIHDIIAFSNKFQDCIIDVVLINLHDELVFHDNNLRVGIKIRDGNEIERNIQHVKNFLKTGSRVFLIPIFDRSAFVKKLWKNVQKVKESLALAKVLNETLEYRWIFQLLILIRLEALGFFDNNNCYLKQVLKKIKNAKVKIGENLSFSSFIASLMKQMLKNKSKAMITDAFGGNIINFHPAIIMPEDELDNIQAQNEPHLNENHQTIHSSIVESWHDIPGIQELLDENIICKLMEKSMQRDKKKKSGAFFTPILWATFTCAKAIEYLDVQLKDGRRHFRILDPAAGYGDFLIAMAEILVDFHANWMLAGHKREHDMQRFRFKCKLKRIYKHELHAIDINKLAIQIINARIFLNIAKHATTWQEKLELATEFRSNLKNKDFLLCRLKPESYDLVVGNPPYLIEVRKNQDLFQTYRTHQLTKKLYEPKMDIFYMFMSRGIDLLKKGGLEAFIVQEYWLNRYHAKKIRKVIFGNTLPIEFIFFRNYKIFQSAPGHHSMFIIIKKHDPVPTHEIKIKIIDKTTEPPERVATNLMSNDDKNDGLVCREIPIADFYDEKNDRIYLNGANDREFLKNLKLHEHFMLEKDEIQIGINIPQAFTKIEKGKLEGIFVLTKDQVEKMSLNRRELEILRPFHEGKELDAFKFKIINNYWLIYSNNQVKNWMENSPRMFPNLTKHLERYQGKITSDHKPFGLHRPRQPEWFEDPNKIVGLRKTKYPKFTVVPVKYYTDQSCVFIKMKHSRPVSPYYLCAYLNSKIAFQLFSIMKTQGKQLQIDKSILLEIPIPIIAKRARVIVTKISEWMHAISIIQEIK
ncbi:MAG: Eco57I restriction-modification methylase domain-containing protein, partial [Promethearchaeota archaeon]